MKSKKIVREIAGVLLETVKSAENRKKFLARLEKDPRATLGKLIDFAPSRRKTLESRKDDEVKEAAALVSSVLLAVAPETVKVIEAVKNQKGADPFLFAANAIVLWTGSDEQQPETQSFSSAKNKAMSCFWAKADLAKAFGDYVEALNKLLECIANNSGPFPSPQIPSACSGDVSNHNAEAHKLEVAIANEQRLCGIF